MSQRSTSPVAPAVVPAVVPAPEPRWWTPDRLEVPDDAPDDLVDMVRDFAPPVTRARATLDPWRASALGGVLGRGSLDAGEPLPLGWHEVWFRDALAHGSLAEDGHAEDHALMPRRRPRRRVYAGATLVARGSLRVGDTVDRVSGVQGCRLVHGRTGWLVLLEEAHRYAVDGRPGLEETRRVVLRYDDPSAPSRPTHPPAAPAGSTPPPEPHGTVALEVVVDPVLLFRFSALTYNPHRIHYDRDYAVGVEGHADLLVHGPLTGLLGLEAARASALLGGPPTRYDFRLRAPAHPGRPLVLTVDPAADPAIDTATDPAVDALEVVARQDGRVVLTAEVA